MSGEISREVAAFALAAFVVAALVVAALAAALDFAGRLLLDPVFAAMTYPS